MRPVPTAPHFQPHQWTDGSEQSPRKKLLGKPVLIIATVALGGLLVGVCAGTATVMAIGNGRAPNACIEALGQADEGFNIAGRAFDSVAAMITAASSYSTSLMRSANKDLEDSTDEIRTLAPKYHEAWDACRANK